MNRRKQTLSVNAFLVFIIIAIISIIIGIIIGFSLNKNNEENPDNIKPTEIQYSNKKAFSYASDLNGDGSKESISIEFLGTEGSSADSIIYNTLNIVVVDGQTLQEYKLTKENDNFFPNVYAPNSAIVNISSADSFKEIYISGTLGDSSPDYKMNLLVEYTGTELKEIKVNKYSEGMVKTFDYETKPDSNYIMEGVYTKSQFYISENQITLYSNSNKKIIYKLNENRELVLDKCLFDDTADYYTKLLQESQLSIGPLKVYQSQNTNSNSQEVTEFNKVTKVDDNWLTVELKNSRTGYIYIEDVKDTFKV